ncbi:gamma-glutamylcyclotransferase family protein [Sneathiella aquimaris]|uniref:gamma-glutamylcyclotransferase family protein n=1 Tax=Sneathiella aquimaris TaxID=2599305 RepID=UPI00146F0E35|nr:gamma-glutamylcyclotransferase family protein [Sneathiella aquimaris]
MTDTYIFVYGTLRKDSPQAMARLLVANSAFLGPAQMKGMLYDLGRYPGMVRLSDAGRNTSSFVNGELFHVLDPDTVLPALDYYEECGDNFSQPTLYVREKETVFFNGNHTVQAWVYLYNRDITGFHYIESGDYLSYLTDKSGTG